MGKDMAWEPALGVGRGSYCAGAVPTTGVSYGALALLTTCTEEAGCSRKARVMAVWVGTRAGVSHGRERQGGGSGNNLGERWWVSATRRRPHNGEKGQTGKIFGR